MGLVSDDVLYYDDEILEETIVLNIKTIAEKRCGAQLSGSLKTIAQVICAKDPNRLKLSHQEEQCVLDVVSNESVGLKTKFLASFILSKVNGHFSLMMESFQKKVDTSICNYLLLLITIGSKESQRDNLSSVIKSITSQNYFMRPQSMGLLLYIAMKYPEFLDYPTMVQPLEAQFSNWLVASSLYITKMDQNPVGLLLNNLITTKRIIVTEIDGNPCRDFVTLLNQTPLYGRDHVFQMNTYSMLPIWLEQVHLLQKNEIDPTFKESIVRYCFRVIDQSTSNIKLMQSSSDQQFSNIILVHSIRILDIISQIDPDSVKTIFPRLKKIFLLPTIGSTPTSSSFVFISILEYIVHNTRGNLYHFDTIFKYYFETILPVCFKDPAMAFEVLNFCSSNMAGFSTNNCIFSQYFRIIFYMCAWHNICFKHFFLKLIPVCLSGIRMVEFLHTIIDIPLMTAAFELIETTAEDDLKYSNSVASNIRTKYTLLFDLLLRKEAGLVVNLWDTPSTKSLLDCFWNDVKITPRILGAVECSIDILEVYYEVVLHDASEEQLIQLIPIMIQRTTQLFPLNIFQKSMKCTLINKLLIIFEKFPNMIYTFLILITTLIDNAEENIFDEMIPYLIFMIGNCANPTLCKFCTPQILSRYQFCLQSYVYQLLSLNSKIGVDRTIGSNECKKIYNTRVMLILMSSLAKLAIRCPLLIDQTRLCFKDILRNASLYDSVVSRKAGQLLNLFNYPKLLPLMLNDFSFMTYPSLYHPNQLPSLPVLLEPITLPGDSIPSQVKLHDFEL